MRKIFPRHGATLSRLWRANQLEYTWLRSLMGRYEDFWRVTSDALIFACRNLRLTTNDSQLDELMSTYLQLEIYPDVAVGLEKLLRLPLRVLSNGSPNRSGVIADELDYRPTAIVQNLLELAALAD